MEIAELVKKIRKIEIRTRRLSQQLLVGSYHTAFKGRGMSFSEVRSYQFGDDVRHIDWNVTARTGEPHLKVFEEEREQTIMLIIDVSQSIFFDNHNVTKNEYILELGAVLAFAAATHQDRVGLLIFSDQIEQFIPPQKGRSHTLLLLKTLLQHKPRGKQTSLSVALQFFNKMQQKRCVAFVLSDFINVGTDFHAPLRVAARRHDLIGIQVIDPREKKLPKVGLMRAYDAETNAEQWIDTQSATVRAAYENHFEEQTKQFVAQFEKNGAAALQLETTVSYEKLLSQFFRKRTQN